MTTTPTTPRLFLQSVAFALFAAIIYFLINRFTGDKPGVYLVTFFDHSIPFTPSAVFGYALGFTFIFIPVLFFQHSAFLKKVLWGFILCTALAAVLYFVFPSRLPRHGVPTQEKFFYWCVALIYTLDRPVAAMPSLLALYGFLSAWTILPLSRRIGWGILAAGVIFSAAAVALRQQLTAHILLAALVAYAVFLGIIKPTLAINKKAIKESAVPLLTVGKRLALFYGIIILAAYLLFIIGVRFPLALPEN
ncbi:MAG TPA: hypothetical protein PLY93_08070 [Turneriella sp.]|nr:hypothetical protein [Turneriella sp.]